MRKASDPADFSHAQDAADVGNRIAFGIAGIGPDALQFDRLLERAGDGQVQEVILATNFTAEGETTAHHLAEMLTSQGLKVTRLARGVPAGSELEYVDPSTIAWALMERRAT